MALKDDIFNKAKAIIDEKFEIEEVDYVPELSNSKLTFGCTGLLFDATVLYIDMRGSTKILNKHNKSSVAKIHMIYFHTIVKIAKALNGDVRSFNGDSLLVFFQGTTKNELNAAVTAALQMTYALTKVVNKQLETYSAINFGIGLDDGKILCTKIGVGGENNRDLIWIGNSVNKSTVISDKCTNPNYVGISSRVYECLNDNLKYSIKKDVWGRDQKVDIWEKSTITYNDQVETYYSTSWHIEI